MNLASRELISELCQRAAYLKQLTAKMCFRGLRGLCIFPVYLQSYCMLLIYLKPHICHRCNAFLSIKKTINLKWRIENQQNGLAFPAPDQVAYATVYSTFNLLVSTQNYGGGKLYKFYQNQVLRQLHYL